MSATATASGPRRRRGALAVAAGVTAAVVAALPALPATARQEPVGDLEVLPGTVDFGAVEVGRSEERQATAVNTGEASLTVASVAVDASDVVDMDDDCSGLILHPGDAGCSVTLTFVPGHTGELDGIVTFTTDGGEAEIAVLTGVGVPATSTTPSSTAPPTTVPPTTTPIDPTTTLPDVPISDQVRLEECERRAAAATVRFAPELEMTVGEPERFVVVASVDDSATTVATDTPTTIAPVALRCEVQARLRASAFDIDPAEFQVASFLDRPTITWSWDVVARSSGDRTLTLEIRSVAYVGGKPIVGAGGELYTAAVHVVARPESWWERSKRWSGEVVDHPLVRGLGSLVVAGGVVAGAWRWLLRRPWPWTGQEARPEPGGGDFEGSDGGV